MAEDLDPETLEALHKVFDMVRNGNTAELADAVDHGLPVNLTNEKGDTLLILSAYAPHFDVVKLLVERGADLERVNDRGQTALAAAVFRRATDVVTLLLEAGADTKNGSQSAEMVANFFELEDMAELLRKHD